MDRLQEISGRLSNATTGPWEQNQSNVTVKGRTLFFTYMANRRDAEFVAHARQDIPYLLDALERISDREQSLRNAATAVINDLKNLESDGIYLQGGQILNALLKQVTP